MRPAIERAETLTIGPRYNGPPTSAHGGYTCGLLARHAATASVAAAGTRGAGRQITVTLHEPPPLGTALLVHTAGHRLTAWHGDRLVATAAATDRVLPAVELIEPDEARAAEHRFSGRQAHPFPTCFVCGTRRGDGLGLAPGPIAGRSGVVACTWTPDAVDCDATEAVPDELTWAVLDCPGGWTTDPASGPMVLSRMTARLLSRPRAGQTYVVLGRLESRNAHTATNTTTLYHRDGIEVGRASATWQRLSGTAPDPNRTDEEPTCSSSN